MTEKRFIEILDAKMAETNRSLLISMVILNLTQIIVLVYGELYD